MCGTIDKTKNVMSEVGNIVPMADPGGMWEDFTGVTGAKEASEGNIRSAREQMKFQERMSSTAHQREVEDLRKAGINPLLTGGGSGASTPSGASASMIPKPATREAVLGLVDMFMGLKATSAQVAKDKATTANIIATTPDPEVFKTKVKSEAESAGYSAKGLKLGLNQKEVIAQLWEDIKNTKQYYGLETEKMDNRSIYKDSGRTLRTLIKALVEGQF